MCPGFVLVVGGVVVYSAVQDSPNGDTAPLEMTNSVCRPQSQLTNAPARILLLLSPHVRKPRTLVPRVFHESWLARGNGVGGSTDCRAACWRSGVR